MGEGAEHEAAAPVVRHGGSGTATGSAPPWCVTPPGRRPSLRWRTGGSCGTWWRRLPLPRSLLPARRSNLATYGARLWGSRLAARGDGSIVVAISATRDASMSTYNYGCERCGLFTETRPMAEFAIPQPSRNCGDLATRALIGPTIGSGAREGL